MITGLILSSMESPRLLLKVSRRRKCSVVPRTESKKKKKEKKKVRITAEMNMNSPVDSLISEFLIDLENQLYLD